MSNIFTLIFLEFTNCISSHIVLIIDSSIIEADQMIDTAGYTSLAQSVIASGPRAQGTNTALRDLLVLRKIPTEGAGRLFACRCGRLAKTVYFGGALYNLGTLLHLPKSLFLSI